MVVDCDNTIDFSKLGDAAKEADPLLLIIDSSGPHSRALRRFVCVATNGQYSSLSCTWQTLVNTMNILVSNQFFSLCSSRGVEQIINVDGIQPVTTRVTRNLANGLTGSRGLLMYIYVQLIEMVVVYNLI